MKMTMTTKAILAGAALVLASSSVWAGTVTYKGTGHAVTTYVVLPLGHGGGAVHLTNSSVATIEPSEVGFMFGECAGLGYSAKESEEISGEGYCTFQENASDSFDIKAKFGGKGGDVQVIGGSGKWAGATGTGTFTHKFVEGNRSTFAYEFKITTP